MVDYRSLGEVWMKFLVINGSPRRENTWKIVERVKSTLSDMEDNLEFDEIDLIEENIPYCMACYNCFTNGEEYCPHSNQIKPIVEKMFQCDALIITSPVYALNVTALVKNLIDHLAYFYHRPAFFESKAMIIVTTAGAGKDKVGNYLDETLRNMGYNERYKLCFVHSHDGKGCLPLKTKQKIDKETKKFYYSIKSGKLSSPSMKAMLMYNVWRAMAYNRHIPLDSSYWEDNDLINHEFNPKVPCNFIKKIPFKIFYKIMLRFLKNNEVKSE